MIFSHLPKPDILKSTLISTTANRIIGNSVQLMKNFSFQIREGNLEPGTRKYSKFDFYGLDIQAYFADTPAYLTQLVFEECNLKADAIYTLLARVCRKLELLIFKRCYLHVESSKQVDNDDDDIDPNFQKLHLPRLKTLIIHDLFRNKFSLLSMIKATNLNELGIISTWLPFEGEIDASQIFTDLVQCNPKLKILHIPPFVIKVFFEALKNPKFDLHLEELGP